LLGAELLAQFAERVAEYKVAVRQITPAELPSAIAAACAACGVRYLVAPVDIPRRQLSSPSAVGR
jgi:hypothetical protein